MRELERARDLHQHPQVAPEVGRAGGAAPVGEALVQALPRDHFHHDLRVARGVYPELMNRHDVRVLDRAHRPGLAQELVSAVIPVTEHNLHRHLTAAAGECTGLARSWGVPYCR